MKRLLTIATITALTSAFAAEVTWNGDGAYALGADDTMTFSENATITAASAFTGSGTIIVSDGTLTLNYKISETPFSGFTGAIRIDGGATVDENSSQGFSEDGTYSTSVFGPSATIIFNGGTLRGFKGQNNSQITGPVEVRSDSTFQNDRSNSGSGVNLRFRSTVSFTGDKTLTINSNDRWVEFANGVDFSAFTGGIVLNGNSTQEAALYGTNYGESASWTFDANRDFRIAPGTGNTVKFGAIDAQNGRIKLDGNNVTVEVGSKTDSAISVPFTNKAFALKKVGAGTSLVLSSEATLLDGSSINVAEGTLEIDGQDLSAITVTFAADSTLKLDSTSKATIGTAFGKLDFASGAKLSFSASGLASGEHTLFTYNNENPIASVSDVVEVTGISANASVQISDDNGTVKATIDIPTLVWNGEQANWTDANAWTVGETKCTFCEGDKVSFTNESSVFLSSEVSLGGMAIAESATVTITGSNGAKITANSLVNNGSLIIIGDVVLDSQITGSVLVSANSTLTFVSGQSIENLKFTGTGTVKFNTADTMDCTYANLYSNGVFTNFEGILELTGGAKIKNTSGLNDNGKVFFPAGMTLRLNGGSVTESAESVNVTVNANIEILGGGDFSYNSIFTKAANFNMTGKITGSGKATFESGKRGFHISGDNSDFTGSLRIKASRGGSNGYGAGFNGSLSGGSKAAWTLSGTEHESRDGSIRTFYIKGITSADAPICFGALNVPDASCYVQLQNDPCYMTVGSDECAEDSTIEGRFIYKKVSLVKQGRTTLTLGKGFEIVNGTSSSSLSSVDGSTVRVDAGTLAVNATNLNAAVTVESGATLAGTGTVYSVVFNDGAKVGFDGLTDTPEPGDIVEGIVVGSLDGATPAIANAPVCTKGKWKLRTKSVEAGTQFYAEFVKRGFCVIVQ